MVQGLACIVSDGSFVAVVGEDAGTRVWPDKTGRRGRRRGKKTRKGRRQECQTGVTMVGATLPPFAEDAVRLVPFPPKLMVLGAPSGCSRTYVVLKQLCRPT